MIGGGEKLVKLGESGFHLKRHTAVSTPLYKYNVVHMVCMSHQAKDEQSAMEEKYRNELNAHIKLSSLYKVRIAAWHLG